MEGDYVTEVGTDGSLLFVCVDTNHAGRYVIMSIHYTFQSIFDLFISMFVNFSSVNAISCNIIYIYINYPQMT